MSAVKETGSGQFLIKGTARKHLVQLPLRQASIEARTPDAPAVRLASFALFIGLKTKMSRCGPPMLDRCRRRLTL